MVLIHKNNKFMMSTRSRDKVLYKEPLLRKHQIINTLAFVLMKHLNIMQKISLYLQLLQIRFILQKQRFTGKELSKLFFLKCIIFRHTVSILEHLDAVYHCNFGFIHGGSNSVHHCTLPDKVWLSSLSMKYNIFVHR